MVFIENEGAVFRSPGPSIYFPAEVFSLRQKKWIPYTGDVPKPQGWGEEISEDEAKKFVESVGGAWDGDAAPGGPGAPGDPGAPDAPAAPGAPSSKYSPRDRAVVTRH